MSAEWTRTFASCLSLADPAHGRGRRQREQLLPGWGAEQGPFPRHGVPQPTRYPEGGESNTSAPPSASRGAADGPCQTAQLARCPVGQGRRSVWLSPALQPGGDMHRQEPARAPSVSERPPRAHPAPLSCPSPPEPRPPPLFSWGGGGCAALPARLPRAEWGGAHGVRV